ncbi:MAG TPA: hypothetical protein VJP40_02310 [bacterium]|nr:hypothetical protein [bacterium]
MAQPQIRPFDFSKLKKLSSRQLATVDSLLRLYPQFSQAEPFAEDFTRSFERDLGLGLKLEFVGFEESSASDFIAAMPNPTVLVLLSAQPAGQAALVELDYVLCRKMVDRVLGQPANEGETGEEPRPFSPLEEGALEFLLAKAVHQLKDSPSFQGPAAFRIVKIVSEPRLLADAVPPEEWGCVLKFYLGLEGRGGYVRVYLPHPLVEGVFIREDIATDVSDAEFEQRLERVAHIKTSIWSEVGRVHLMASEIGQLERGDVILFDESQASKGPHGLSGKTVLRVGESSSEGLLSELIDSEGKVVVKILDFLGGE